jgi:hypothetical protein
LFVALIAWVLLSSVEWRGRWDLFHTISFVFAAAICVGVELNVVAAVFFDLGSITLDAEGFEVRSLWTRLRRSWRDVDGFEVEWFQRWLRVTYINTAASTGALRFHQWIAGNREALSYTYGFGRSDFARLLTQWRERAVGLSRPLN